MRGLLESSLCSERHKVLAIWDPRWRTRGEYGCGVEVSIGPVLLEVPDRYAVQVRLVRVLRKK